MTKRLLLDINALLALGWSNHPFHRPVRERLLRMPCPWATCALVQLGFLRLSMNPAAVLLLSADKGLIQHFPGIVEPLRL